MASPDPHPRAGDVRVAIICALKIEYDAVKLAYEHIWEDDRTQDGYGYSTGRIGGHASLLACCEAGKANAAGVASHIRSRYRGIKLTIVAGICGGVPRAGTDKELFLGDVVISTSIFQYDYGRRNTDKFRPKVGIEDALPVPGREICSFLNILQTRDAHKKLQSETSRILQDIQGVEPETYKRPGDTEDYLYEADYVHKHRNSPRCDCNRGQFAVCDEALEATCEQLGCKDPAVTQRPLKKRKSQSGESRSTSRSPGAGICARFGVVGSGDTVMKSGRDRDDVAKRHNLTALEMEGAGVRKYINDSIVVKSVCDYADSHKNKNWQDFAAAVAASATKALLEQFSYENEPEPPRISRKYDHIEMNLLPLLAAEHERYKDFNPEKVEGTCEWFFKDHRFLEWLNCPSGILWVSAGPGCGKSVLAKALIDEQRLSKPPEKTTICYFFKAGEERRTSSSDALSTILHQLFDAKRGSELIQHAEGSFTCYGKQLRDNFHQLWDILTSCAKNPDAGEIVCVLDALDECDEPGRKEILMKLRTFDKAQSRLKFLITGRPYDHLEDEFKGLSEKGVCIQLDGDDKSEEIGKEINLVIDHKVNIITRHWEQLGVKHRQQLLERLKGMENRTYLWLHLTMDIIEKRRSLYRKYSNIEELLDQLPLDASEAYEKILSHSQDRAKARCLLQIILAATRPLTLQELNHCFTLQEEQFSKHTSYTYNDLQAELEPSATFASTVRNLCGLFLSVHDGKVSFIHKTARDFLITKSESRKRMWQGEFRLASAHNVIFVSCVRLISLQNFDVLAKEILVEAVPWKDVPVKPNKFLPFMLHAVSNWTDHYNSQDEEDKNRCIQEARELCRIPERQGRAPTWFELRKVLRTAYGGNENNWTDLTFSTFLGLFEIVAHLVDQEKVDVNERGGQFGTAVKSASYLGHTRLVRILCQHGANCEAAGGKFRTALLAAVHSGRLEVIKYLLDEKTGAQVTQEVIEVAAKDISTDKEMMSFLLDRCSDAAITEEIVLHMVVRDPELVRLLLERHRDKIEITTEVVEILAAYVPSDILALLLDTCGDTIQVTPNIVENAAVSYEGTGSLCLLLERYGDMIQITPNVMEAAAGSWEGDEILGFLLEKFESRVEITLDVVITAAGNYSCGKETIAILLEKGHFAAEHLKQHMEAILRAASKNKVAGEEVIAMFLEEYGNLVEITSSILWSAARWGSEKTMALLLEKRGDEIQVTQEMLLAIFANRSATVKMIATLLEKRRGGGQDNSGGPYCCSREW
ncbi:nacht and ankyrin domain protein [Colletotrichum musicola]|uniref:Nacht and ankyrin domain protein n=1 Tax=Colletotrichum musicola TaxID=2175873 RepID=A0A8H6KBK2_9PEZI|nr:nacht and ankyrin domain protein [Colletotrichum musicola]